MDLTHGKYIALLDTGATSSWISPRVISDLDLVEIAKERVSFALDQQMAGIYLFRLGLFAEAEDVPSIPYVFAETEGFRLRQRDDFDVILGMDILKQGRFEMYADGAWELEFN